MKTFRSDLGGEFTSNEQQGYFKKLGIYFETSSQTILSRMESEEG